MSVQARHKRKILLAGVLLGLAGSVGLAASAMRTEDVAPLRLVSPRDGAVLEAAPRFEWTADRAQEQTFVVLVMVNRPGVGLWPEAKIVGRETLWQMPGKWWEEIVKDDSAQPSFWMVYGKTVGGKDLSRGGPFSFYPVTAHTPEVVL